jgi:hypothetical protein
MMLRWIRRLLPQHDCAALVVPRSMLITAIAVGFLRHGVLLDFGTPGQPLLLAGRLAARPDHPISRHSAVDLSARQSAFALRPGSCRRTCSRAWSWNPCCQICSHLFSINTDSLALQSSISIQASSPSAHLIAYRLSRTYEHRRGHVSVLCLRKLEARARVGDAAVIIGAVAPIVSFPALPWPLRLALGRTAGGRRGG